jgi:tetratricopeptide (TPR) repeat protein
MCVESQAEKRKSLAKVKTFRGRWSAKLAVFLIACAANSSIHGQSASPDWKQQVRQCAGAQDWECAIRIVDREAARSPKDLEVRAWRARVLAWSGHWAEAEKAYLEIATEEGNDPDNWMGLGNVYLREGKVEDALRALDRAEELDPKRADLHAARGRVLRAKGDRSEAQAEFEKALRLNPGDDEARAGLISVRGEFKQELRLGQDNDVFNFADANRGEWTSLVSKWTPVWTTSVASNSYQRGGELAGKFTGSVTAAHPKWGALTIGGAAGHDSGVIPKREAFFDADHGWKTGKTTPVRAVELDFGQHWYWYQASHILSLNGAAILYFPRAWTLTIRASGARSAFSGAGIEWRPSGTSQLGFPLARRSEKSLSGNIFFGVGTENFAEVDQIGSFASQTYGGGLRFQFTARQDVSAYGSYQRRTGNRTDKGFGLSYGIHF